MTKHLTIFLFNGLAFWGCMNDNSSELPYKDLKWLRYHNGFNKQYYYVDGLVYWIPIQADSSGTIIDSFATTCNFIHLFDKDQYFEYLKVDASEIRVQTIETDDSSILFEYEENS